MDRIKNLPNFWKSTIQVIGVIIVSVLVASIIKAFLFQGFYIPSESMLPTLEVNDRIIVNQLYPEPLKLQRGNIIVFKDDAKWMGETNNPPYTFIDFLNPLKPNLSENFLVKRVIGLPGDTISYNYGDQWIKINGKDYIENYLPTNVSGSDIEFSVTVPDNHVWVMGDNRINSSDSRYNQDKNGGFISYEDIVGKAEILYYPIPHITSL